jgi:hypothetical protein
MLRGIAGCAGLLITAALAAQTPSALSDDRLLQSLAGPDWRQRRQAIHEIIELGPQADGRVSDLLKRNLDQEQRKNVELALQLIRDNRLFGPSLISLNVKDAPAASVIDSVATQCAGPLPSSPSDLLSQGEWPKLTLNYDRRPFWEVMNDLAGRLKIDFLLSEPQEVRLTRAGGRHDFITTSGAFLFTVGTYGMPRRGLTLDLAVYAEPKVLVLRTLDLKLERAVDDQGNVLTPQSGRGFRGRGGMRWNQVRSRNGPRQVTVQFQRPPGDRIAELRGNVKLAIQETAAKWEIADVLEMSPATRIIQAIPVTLDSVRNLSDETCQLQLSIPYGWDHTGPEQDEVIDLMHRGLALYDAAGKPLTMDVPEARQQTSSTEIDVNFSRGSGRAKAGPPAKLIWTIPDKVREMFVPFEFKNIPIDDPFN